MSHLARIAVRALIEPAVQYQSAAEPRAKGHKDHVLISPSRTEFPLGERARIGIVLELSHDTKMPFRKGGYFDAVPLGKIWRAHYYAARGVEGTSA